MPKEWDQLKLYAKYLSQYVERILFKIENTFDGNSAGWKIMSGVQKIFHLKSQMYGNSTRLDSIADSAWSRLIWLSCRVCGFYGRTYRNWTKIYSKPSCMLFHPVKVLLRVFSILFQAFSVYRAFSTYLLSWLSDMA